MTDRFSFSWYGVVVAALFLLAAFYSFYELTESPPAWYDEGLYIQVADSISERGRQSVQLTPSEHVSSGFITGGYPFLAPVALSLSVLGDSLFAARLPMAFFILLFLFVAWRFAARSFSEREAVLSLLLLATLPLLYGNGKNVLGEVPGLFYLTLSLLLLQRIEAADFRGVWLYAGAGLTAGLAVATKPVYLLFPAAIGLALLFRFRSVVFRFKEIAVASAAFLAPVALWLFLQFGAGDKAGSTLSYYANPYAVGSFLDTMMGNALRFFTEATPLYCGLLVAAWVLAVFLRIKRAERISLAEISAFIFALLVLFAYLRTAGWYRYFFQTLVLALLFFPHALSVITSRWDTLAQRAVVGVVLILGLFQLYQLNFSSFVAEHYESRASEEATRYFGAYPRERSLFVYDAPEVIPFLASENYYQYIKPHPVRTLGDLSLLEGGIPDEVLVPSARLKEAEPYLYRYEERERTGPYVIFSRN